MKSTAAEQATTAPDSQVKSIRKPALSIVPQTEESYSGASDLAEIIEFINCKDTEPVPPSAVSHLYDVAHSYIQLALTLGGCSNEYNEQGIAQLALLQKCVQASKSGTLNLSRQEMKRCASIFALRLFREIRAWAEWRIEEEGEVLNED